MKSGLTETKYQSTFLPLIQRAETEIKRLINEFALFKKSKYELKQRIKAIIELVDKKLPPKLYDRAKYIKGLEIVSEKMIKEYYDKVIRGYLLAVGILIGLGLPEPKNPYELNKIITEPKNLFNGVDLQTKKEYISLWAEAKGSPYIENYPQALKDKMTELAETTTRSGEGGKQPLSLWQKAEIDLRYQKQMERIEELKRNGVELAYISSHPDCSKRCEKLQGHLVSLTEHAENPQRVVKNSDYSDLRISTYRVKRIGNQWVYSLPDIMATETKGGWNNMIICGFNCFDKETEVLTDNGWKLFNDLTDIDLIYTLNMETKTTEWQKPINYYKSLYNGEMIHFKSYISDLMTTPNHNFIYYKCFNKTLRFKEAEKINEYDIQYAGQEWEGNDTKTLKIGSTEINSKLFCRLLAYWLADGSIHDNNSIKIAQQNNDEMWNNLQDLPYRLWRDNNKIIVRDKDLHDLLKPLGICNTKYVFKWVKELSKECLNEFLEAYIFTDGYRAKPTTINGRLRKPHQTLFTTSKQLCSDLCEIALKCGYRPKIEIKHQKGESHTFKNGTYIFNHDVYVIHLNRNVSFKYKSIERVNYNDYIYCVEVPNHTLLVKRNGFIQWCGNCRHRLIAYTGQLPPKEYSSEDIKKEREINAKMREMERRIKLYKQQSMIYNKTDKKLSKQYEVKANKLLAEYKKFANDNGFATELYRTKI